jgi:hypothetical protein
MQMIGLSKTSPENSAFVTTLFNQFVPIVPFVVYRILPKARDVVALEIHIPDYYQRRESYARDRRCTHARCAICFACLLVALDAFTDQASLETIAVGQFFG